MPSSITPTLSAVAAQVMTPQTARAEAQGGVTTAAQLAQLSQDASQRTSTEVRPDAERTPQVPKKVEGGYSAQSLRKKKPKSEEGKDAEETGIEKDKDSGGEFSPLNVVA